MELRGYIKVDAKYLDRLIQALEIEGFNPKILQILKKGQLWGAAKRIDHHSEWHVRVIDAKDSHERFLVIESEIEVPRDYIEHISPKYSSDPYYKPLLEALRLHNIPCEVLGSLSDDPALVTRPNKYTEWKRLLLTTAASILTGAGLIWLANKAIKLRRRTDKA